MIKDTFVKDYRYVKGVYEMKVFDPTTRDLLYYDNKITENNFATSVNMNPLTAGVGNPNVIQIPDGAKIDVTLTAQDVDLRARQLQVGGSLGYNGITDTCEIVTASGTTLTVSATPVAPYGTDVICAYINNDGTAYRIDPATKQVQGFTAESGKVYSVRYYIAKAASEVLNIEALFNPSIVTLEVKMPTYSVPSATTSAMQGSLIGYWHYIIPRFQFGGDAGLQANQTTAGTTALSGTALAYDNADASCTASIGSLGYMVFEPLDATANVEGMFVIGGIVNVPVGGSVTVPVKYVMKDGGTAQPDFAELTFAIPGGDNGIATVSATGVITGAGAGDTEITVTNAALGLSCVANVSVTA